ncbi:hypothetical protein [Mesorhizobium sp.]|uniref:hypothetical protein n=1 Tax=Mesorhizobium sp. TaxID=1871066 RepID=UPI0025CE7BE9|nr:hypothetical protein [Mesorhizobium sp.]
MDLAFKPDVARAVRQKSFNFRRDGRIVLHVEVRSIYQSTGPEAPLSCTSFEPSGGRPKGKHVRLC